MPLTFRRICIDSIRFLHHHCQNSLPPRKTGMTLSFNGTRRMQTPRPHTVGKPSHWQSHLTVPLTPGYYAVGVFLLCATICSAWRHSSVGARLMSFLISGMVDFLRWYKYAVILEICLCAPVCVKCCYVMVCGPFLSATPVCA